jgi:hypothetical protein
MPPTPLPQGITSFSPEGFLAHFPGHSIQYFDDSPRKDASLALCTGQLDRAEAARRQALGCGVYFSPNAFDGGRTTEKLRHVQALYLDIDCAKEGDGVAAETLAEAKAKSLAALEAFPLRPHAVIGTKHGLQSVWRVHPLPPAEGKRLFDEAEAMLIPLLAADPAAKDVTRVLRVPGYQHLKDPAAPYLCSLLLLEFDREPFALPELVTALRALTASGSPCAPRGSGESAAPAAPKKWEAVLGGVGQGCRNDAAASLAGRVLRDLPEGEWAVRGWTAMRAWNDRNTPPLDERELLQVFENIARRERQRHARQNAPGMIGDANTQADRLLALVTPENCTLFRDQFSRPFASIRVAGRHETWPVRGKHFRMWLSSLLWEAEHSAPRPYVLSAALTVLEARACFEGERLQLSNRVAWHEGALWYDLSNERWEAVRVTEEGWEVVTNPPTVFYRHAHQTPQVGPQRGGDVRALLPFLNLGEDAPAVLLLTYLVSCFLPDIAHPVLVLYGPHGAAKTTLAAMLRRLIDPSAMDTLALPRMGAECVQQLAHHWFAFFDNVTALPGWASDTICRAVTGEGFSKRELFTDDEDVLYAFRRCIGINGLTLAARKPDLLDRSILLRLERIGPGDRKPLKALWDAFETTRPVILGGLFDALAAALRLRKAVQVKQSPRMADFAVNGCAIAEALGYGRQAFLDAYAANVERQHEESMHENPVTEALAAFMEDRVRWRGSPSDLLEQLEEVADRETISTRSRSWPAAANALTMRLNEVRTLLADAGLQVQVQKGPGGRRLIAIERAPPVERLAPAAGRAVEHLSASSPARR